MKQHKEYLENFKEEFSDVFKEFPQLKYVFISMFNSGFSAGSAWMMESQNK